MSCRRRSLSLLALLGLLPSLGSAAPLPVQRFDFGSGPAAPGYTPVPSDVLYTAERGFGFEPGSQPEAVDRGGDPLRGDFVTGTQPFQFTVRVPVEGNYRVTVTLGDASGPTCTTIKAELRRLMAEHVETKSGEFQRVSFIVNVRTPAIPAVRGLAAGRVRLKSPRESEQEARAWDDALTLEFADRRPAVCALEIEPADVPTIFLLGDSTVCDQSKEPFSSWGQMLPRFFQPDVAVANHGESGETYRDSIGRRRLDKVVSLVRPGDWVFLQFGHNDQKQIAAKSGGPFTTYPQEIRRHVEAIRAQRGVPVLITPMERRIFSAEGKVRPTLADYAAATREAARELGTDLVDLHVASIRFYESLESRGREYSRRAFAGQDDTHHNNYGAYQLARAVVQALRDQKSLLTRHLVDELPPFDPVHPDEPDNFKVPASGELTVQRPLGD